MINILTTIAGVFIVMLLVAPIVLLTILIIRTNRPKSNPQASQKFEELAEIDQVIIEQTNEALAQILEKIQDLEERLDREDATVKGFGSKK